MPATATKPKSAPAPRGLMTRQEFERLLDSGKYRDDARYELIDGEMVKREMPVNSPHATCLRRLSVVMNRHYWDGFVVSSQLPLALGGHDFPFPDMMIARGSIDDFEENHPYDAVLVIEVADSSLRYDRTTKAAIYARGGVPEYWVVNLAERRVEKFTQPGRASGVIGYGYLNREILTDVDSIVLPDLESVAIAVSDLLPTR